MISAENNDPYKSRSFIGHSLWACPTGATKKSYTSIISGASSELETFEFNPHITLVAAIMTSAEDVVIRAKELAKELAPYSFEFDEISERDAYFQCVYAKMKRTKEVLDANALAKEFFPERKTDPEYMPHISLVYGNFELAEKQNKIIPYLKKQMENDVPNTKSITVDSIEVWSTKGNVEDWFLVETVPLKGGNNPVIDDKI